MVFFFTTKRQFLMGQYQIGGLITMLGECFYAFFYSPLEKSIIVASFGSSSIHHLCSLRSAADKSVFAHLVF